MADKTLTIEQAADLMGVNAQYIRAALKQDKYPLWGKAVLSPNGKRHKYVILKIPFMRYINGNWDASEVQ